MTDFDPLTFERLPVLMMSGAESSDELLDRLVDLVDSLCAELLAQPDLMPLQIAGVQRTRSRVPAAIDAYRRWVSLFGWSEEATQNALFLLATMADNLLSLGALYMVSKAAEELPPSVTAADFAADFSSKGGRRRAEKEAQAKKSVKERFARICFDLMQEDSNRLAAQLIKAAVKAWGNARPALPDSKQLSTWLQEAVDAGAVPSPRTDGRAKKVRKSAG